MNVLDGRDIARSPRSSGGTSYGKAKGSASPPLLALAEKLTSRPVRLSLQPSTEPRDTNEPSERTGSDSLRILELERLRPPEGVVARLADARLVEAVLAGKEETDVELRDGGRPADGSRFEAVEAEDGAPAMERE